MKKTLCLVMIVRNEERVIERCLNRVKEYIDYWVIVDTGSTDQTIPLIQQTLKSIPGELYQEEWVNFGHNRSQSLAYAKGKADYLLLCDADEQLLFGSEFNSEYLTAEEYMISYVGGNDYSVPYLIKGDLDWFYVGVTHEYLSCRQPVNRAKLDSITILDLMDGGYKHDKFERDIRLLEEGLKAEPTNSRYKFYLANSYRDNNQPECAIEWYHKRIEDGGWREEVTCAYENLGICYELIGEREKALQTWLNGFDYDPSRLECLYNAVRLLRVDGKARLAYHLAQIGIKIPYPHNDILFIKRNHYVFDIYFELSICAYYVQDYQTGYSACKHVLYGNPSRTHLEVTLRNIAYYKEQIKNDSLEEGERLVAFLEEHLNNPNVDTLSSTYQYMKLVLDEKHTISSSISDNGQ